MFNEINHWLPISASLPLRVGNMESTEDLGSILEKVEQFVFEHFYRLHILGGPKLTQALNQYEMPKKASQIL